MTKPLNEYTIREASRALRAHECTVRELWDVCYQVAVEKNPELNAYLEIFPADDSAIDSAQKRIDAEGEKAPLLCGIPLAIKDNILIEGHIASSASRMLQNYIASYDATVVALLKEAGALFLGRTNMDEFALGGSTENSAFGVTKNPHDATRVAGGTSGGTASAVSAHMCIAGLGTDTGGSIRNPASYCGIVGLKPTYGAVSRSGLIAAVSSFDQAGPMTKTVEDAEILYTAIRGIDSLDSTSYVPPTLSKEVKRIGILNLSVEGMSSDTPVFKAFADSCKALEEAGYVIQNVELPIASSALSAYYIINFAEVSTNLARFDGVRYGASERGDTLLEDYIQSRSAGFGPETKRRILLGTYVLSAGYIDAFYKKADAVREKLREEFADAFKQVDVIATPTMPTPAFVIGEKADPVSLYLEDMFTVLANLTGIPAISVPMNNVEKDGVSLPVGIQFMAPHGGEERLCAIAKTVTGEAV